ncbi:hypothetical protein GCM10023211_04430 [Orbus sasakiae]|uniref:Uncharacterized protein n=1 Tax=Orbus sasakiae TaxID=1078475 RepID=A0ABP9N603_9GAMM
MRAMPSAAAQLTAKHCAKFSVVGKSLSPYAAPDVELTNLGNNLNIDA